MHINEDVVPAYTNASTYAPLGERWVWRGTDTHTPLKHSSSLLCPSTSSRLRSHASTAPSSTARPVSCLDHTVYNRRFAVLGVVCPPAFVSPFPLSLSLMALCFSCLPHSPSLFSAPPSAFIGRPSAASGAWNIVDDVTHGGEATSIPIDTRCLHESRHTCE